MTHSVVPADDDALRFAHDLTRDNMAQFYATHRRVWDTSLFEASWPRTENYWVLEDEVQVGILRVTQEAETLYVRDVQIVPAHQRRGAGTFAMQFVGNLALERGVTCIRLNVFADNQAQSLYHRLGFREISREHGSLS
jgi:ribosomal protein S18 acetylase RimI-like enzyme